MIHLSADPSQPLSLIRPFIHSSRVRTPITSEVATVKKYCNDRGHLAAAGNHRKSRNSIDQTFFLTNMSPQVGRGFNRDKWNHVEIHVRRLAKKNRNVYICTGPLYLPQKESDGNFYLFPMAAMMNVNDAWQTFTAPTGEKYYYNWVTLENTWDKPQALIDKEARASTPNNLSGSAQTMIQTMTGVAGLQSVGYAGFQTSIAGSLGSVSSGSSVVAAVNKDVNSSKPVSSTAIPGTPWCVVWTGDKKVFFYNPSINTSVWQRPPELYNRPDVDLLVAIPPDSSEQSHKPAVDAKQSEEDKAEESGEEEEKKADHLEKERKAKKEPVSVKQKPIDPVAQAEIQAQQERNKIPLEGRLRKFRELLEDKNISGASIWEKELSKLVFDERYLLLCAAERKAAFEAFTKERIEIERAERRKRAKEAKVEYKKLLVEADLHGKSSFTSFTKKYGKDPRFKALEKARDREEYFREFTNELYKLEKKTKKKRDHRKEDPKEDRQKEYRSEEDRPKESSIRDGRSKEDCFGGGCIEEDHPEEEQKKEDGLKEASPEEQEVQCQEKQNDNSEEDSCRPIMKGKYCDGTGY
uniref:Endonuclease n=1 Tax=Ditylenchus dipsaci TaxID=166011 RepID=A0A915D3L6_9BILA